MNIVTRFAPSPTGALHIGGIRTALFSWLFARKYNGQFILRIEDTDQVRNEQDAVQMIFDGLSWLGINYDLEPYYQSRRYERYLEVVEQLLATNHAYRCACTKERLEDIRAKARIAKEKPRYDGYCRDLNITDKDTVVRFKNPNSGQVIVNDQVQGNVVFENSELDDIIILRRDRIPTYNLSVVIDDLDMKISHVIRGDDHLNNTPRQMNIFSALHQQPPIYAHIPMVLDEAGNKLSKRDNASSILYYQSQGYLPEALLNYLVRLGWSHGDQEIFSKEEMIRLFDLENINHSASRLDIAKMTWLNKFYLQNTDSHKLLNPFCKLVKSLGYAELADAKMLDLLTVQKQRTATLYEIAQVSRYFFEDFDDYNPSATKKHLRPVILPALEELSQQMSLLEVWDNENLNRIIHEVIQKFEIKFGKLAQAVRVAVTGDSVSPAIDDTLSLLGKDRTMIRIRHAIDFIRQRLDSN